MWSLLENFLLKTERNQKQVLELVLVQEDKDRRKCSDQGLPRTRLHPSAFLFFTLLPDLQQDQDQDQKQDQKQDWKQDRKQDQKQDPDSEQLFF